MAARLWAVNGRTRCLLPGFHSTDARARKPEPAFFAHIQQHAGAGPDECVFIDDLPTNVEAAERFGWRGIVYRPDGTLADKLRAAGVEVGTT